MKRYEHPHPGSMIRVDVTKFGNITIGGRRSLRWPEPGRRVPGIDRAQPRAAPTPTAASPSSQSDIGSASVEIQDAESIARRDDEPAGTGSAHVLIDGPML